MSILCNTKKEIRIFLNLIKVISRQVWLIKIWVTIHCYKLKRYLKAMRDEEFRESIQFD